MESQLLTVRSLAGQAARCFKLEFAELFQEGYLELTEALMRYDYQIGNFTPYAYHRVKERLYQLCASRLGTMNLPRWTAVRRFHETNEHRKGGEQTELVEYQAPIPLEATKERHVSFSEPAFTQIELQHSLDHAMQALTEREEEIIVARFGLDGSRPLSRQELAIKLRSSVGTVRRLEREAIATLKRVLVDE
ncbi:MAG: sigma-70 family RNA polymerase sigma factor [Propionibacteriaceae bacterium]|nr:sigma-70 family RNA polymerase sigma factor [Propionibacteriaceae bacterium]